MAEPVDFEKLQDAAVEITTLHQAAVSRYGSKGLFDLLRKGNSTGFNEMNVSILIDRIEYLSDPAAEPPAQHAKLGFLDLMIGMCVTGDKSPLVAMNKFFGMACHQIPEKKTDPAKASELIPKITGLANKEFTETINEIMDALSNDGRVDRREADKVYNEGMEAINALYEVVSCVDAIRKGGE